MKKPPTVPAHLPPSFEPRPDASFGTAVAQAEGDIDVAFNLWDDAARRQFYYLAPPKEAGYSNTFKFVAEKMHTPNRSPVAGRSLVASLWFRAESRIRNAITLARGQAQQCGDAYRSIAEDMWDDVFRRKFLEAIGPSTSRG